MRRHPPRHPCFSHPITVACRYSTIPYVTWWWCKRRVSDEEQDHRLACQSRVTQLIFGVSRGGRLAFLGVPVSTLFPIIIQQSTSPAIIITITCHFSTAKKCWRNFVHLKKETSKQIQQIELKQSEKTKANFNFVAFEITTLHTYNQQRP